MAATITTFNVALIASSTRFVTAVGKAERQWTRFYRMVQRNSKMLPQSLQAVTPAALTMARTVVKASAVAGTALGTLSGIGLKLAADFEQTRIAFNTLLGDAERANKFLGEMVQFAAETPFHFNELTKAARMLLAYGFEAEEILPMLRSMGDAVAALGGGSEEILRIVRAIGQIRAKGRLVFEEMTRQLTETGIPAWQFLAEYVGVSIPTVMDMVERKLISSEVAIAGILSGMTKRFGGAMEVQARTFRGRLSTLRDYVEIILRGMGEDIIRIFDLKRRIDDLTNATARFASIVTQRGFIGALREAFPPWLVVTIYGIAGAIAGALVPAIIAWLVPALKKLAASLWATIAPLSTWMVVGALVGVTIYALSRICRNFGDVFRGVWILIASTAIFAFSMMIRAGGYFYAFLSMLIPSLQGAANAMFQFADRLRQSAFDMLAQAEAAAQAARNTAQIGQSAQNTADSAQQAADAQNGFADAMEAANKAAKSNIQSFDEVHQIQEEMTATDMAATMPEFAMPEFPALPEFGLGGAIAGMTDQIKSAVEGTTSAWSKLNEAVDWANKNWPQIQSVIEGIAGVLLAALIPALVKTGIEAGVALYKVGAAVVAYLGPQGLILTAIGLAALFIITHWDEISAFLARVWQWIADTATNIWNGVKDFFAGLWEGIKNTAQVVWTAIKDFFVTYWDELLAVFTGPLGWLVYLIANNWDDIKTGAEIAWNAIKDFFTQFWNDIKTLAETIWNGIKDFFAGLWDDIKIAAETVWNGIKDFFSGLWGGIQTTAETIWNGLKGFFSGLWGDIETALKTAWDTIAGWLSSTWDGIKKKASETWDGLVSGVRTLKTDAIDLIKKLVDEIVDWLGSLPQRAVEKVKDFTQGVIDKIRNMYHTIVGGSIIPDMVIGVTAWLQNLNTQGTPIVAQFATKVTGAFQGLFSKVLGQAGNFGTTMAQSLSQLSTSMQSTFQQAFTGILNGSMTFSGAMQYILSGMGQAIMNLIVQQLAQAATASLANLGTWAAGVVAQAGIAIGAMIKQAYATLVAFFAWSGPAAPALAAGVIGAAIVGLGALAARVIGLAEGGIVTGLTFAKLGEDGRKEAVIPLERDNVLADSIGQAVYDAMMAATRIAQASGAGQGDGERQVILEIDGARFARAVLPPLIREGQRRGFQLIPRTQGG